VATAFRRKHARLQLAPDARWSSNPLVWSATLGVLGEPAMNVPQPSGS
jgi:hypothetical protein